MDKGQAKPSSGGRETERGRLPMEGPRRQRYDDDAPQILAKIT
jgi:hypothetical protein